MRNIAQRYFADLSRAMADIEVSDLAGSALPLYEGVEKAAKACVAHSAGGGKIFFIGNGASAAISSHMATDFWKNGGMRAMAFNDGSLLTCMGNDYGYACVFEKPLEMFADSGDLLIAISSSGRSENILRGADAARAKGCGIVTMSGFAPDNPLRGLGDCNFYVPAGAYGPVEIIHQAICHAILDVIMDSRS